MQGVVGRDFAEIGKEKIGEEYLMLIKRRRGLTLALLVVDSVESSDFGEYLRAGMKDRRRNLIMSRRHWVGRLLAVMS